MYKERRRFIVFLILLFFLLILNYNNYEKINSNPCFLFGLNSCTKENSLKLNEFETDVTSFLDYSQKIDDIIGSQKIKSFTDYRNILSTNKFGRYNDLYSDEDLERAFSFLEELNLTERGISSSIVVARVSNYAFVNNLISIETRDFLINNITDFNSIQNLRSRVSIFIAENTLSISEINLLNEISSISGNTTDRMACRVFGAVVGGVAGAVATSAVGPWGGWLAGAFIGAAMEDVCEGIAGAA